MSDRILTISLVQYSPRWEDVHFNLSFLGELFLSLRGKTDLIILPEMFPTGFTMNTGKICSNDNVVTEWMQQQATSTGAMIAGSVAVMEKTYCYNRFYWVYPDGNMGHYDKHHLFTLSDEPQHFTAGTEQKQFAWRGWEIKPIICYDLRFPEWCRNNRTKPYDLLVCVASWPTVRSDVWLTLLKARALENQCFVAAVNRTGTDENGLLHQGDSVLYSPKGEVVGRISEEEAVATFEISMAALHEFRKKFPVLNDMDDFFFRNEE